MEVQIGNSYYYKEGGVWYNEHGEEATRFEIIKIKIMSIFAIFLFVGISGVFIYAAINGEQGGRANHNTENSIALHYGTPEDVMARKCDTYSIYEYVSPNIVMSCSPIAEVGHLPELRIISEPEMFEVTLATAHYYLEQGKLMEGDENCIHHEFIGEDGKVTYEPNDICLR
ncbi:hypothetical protein [Vibrio crassostreae]|uniref:hypothetical protein n=1 Tax=Vibrio crassostreae TaxID=246167 RepID=UPI001B303412|nr:hypothetical protein [Vibrio crassostreae]